MKVNSTKYRKVIINLDLGKNGGHTACSFGGRSIVAIRQGGRQAWGKHLSTCAYKHFKYLF